MTVNDAIEVLHSCHSIYHNLHDKVNHKLTDQELTLLWKFKISWEAGLYCNSELLEKAGMGLYELAFLGGYVYDFDQQPQITILWRDDFSS